MKELLKMANEEAELRNQIELERKDAEMKALQDAAVLENETKLKSFSSILHVHALPVSLSPKKEAAHISLSSILFLHKSL